MQNYPSDVQEELKQLSSLANNDLPTVEESWVILDSVWDRLGCDNRSIDPDKLSLFYQHPVWLFIGHFVEHEAESFGHRKSLANYIKKTDAKKFLDHGGGFGTLARLVAENCPSTNVTIYEPFPSPFVVERLKHLKNLHFQSRLEKYDCISSLDVLEHLEDPISELKKLAEHLDFGGRLILAPCFYPVIKCHLPQTFHLRYTLGVLCFLLGFKKAGKVENTHAFVFIKKRKALVGGVGLSFFEFGSQFLFPGLRLLHFFYSKVKKIIQ